MKKELKEWMEAVKVLLQHEMDKNQGTKHQKESEQTKGSQHQIDQCQTRDNCAANSTHHTKIPVRTVAL
jgi:hypothetical protein